MPQKTISTLFLLFGISLTQTSCNKRTIVEYVVKGEFHYVNKSPYPVDIYVVGGGANPYTRQINEGDSLTLFTNSNSHQTTVNAKAYVPPLLADSTTVFLGDSLCYYETRDEKRLLNSIDAYEAQQLGERSYLFRFLIDSGFVSQAVRCN